MEKSGIDTVGVLLLGVVGLLWGATNPLIEKSVKDKESYQVDDYSPKSVISVATSKLFIVAFGINQLGSLLYASLLGSYKQQYTNLLANSFATVFTFAAENIISRQVPKARKLLGMALIIVGLFFILI